MEITNKPERRIYPSGMEVRTVDGKTTIIGMAAVFNSLSRDLGGFREQILPGAFDNCDMSDVQCLFNHDGSQILARSFEGEGTLRLKVTEQGLQYEFDAPSHSIGEYVAEAIERKDIRHSSFAFDVASNGDKWEEDREKGYYLRSISSFKKLYDVSPVTNPAYWGTQVDTRGLENIKNQNTETSPGESYYSRLRLDHYKK